MAKVRLDQLMVERGLADSRTRAQALILAGKVSSPDYPNLKPGTNLDQDAKVTLTTDEGYASRGAYKLIGALDHFGINPEGLVCVDLGASTGGFTDVLLRRGAKKVFAVDVGKNLLDERLRRDPAVIVMDQTNARDLPNLGEQIDLLVCDVSFISVTKLFPALKRLADLSPNLKLLLMIKPQFELDEATASKNKGVIRDEQLQLQAVQGVREAAVKHSFTAAAEVFPSPLKGPKGNQEYFLYLKKN
jgi:23S rRNA (cytidine1920-2'-O)/16S rRNA (cytidine1409-2'-O)-methyltransferase